MQKLLSVLAVTTVSWAFLLSGCLAHLPYLGAQTMSQECQQKSGEFYRQGMNPAQAHAELVRIGCVGSRGERGVVAARPTAQSPPRAPAQVDPFVSEIQTRPNAAGYDSGEVDGLLGPRTTSAIKAFQRDRGITADGRPTPDLLRELDSL